MKQSTIVKKSLIGAALLAGMGFSATAQDKGEAVEVHKVNDSMVVLYGAGGNTGVHFGADGVYLIDDDYGKMSKAILAKVKEITGRKPTYVINTHYHDDHTGGNQAMGKTGAIIIAHDNVRQRLTKESFIKAFNMRTPATPKVGLPQITFNEELSIHLNGEEARLMHVKNAHTDGDSMIYFKKSNVIHMGDTMFNGRYPFIDVGGGGGITGVIFAVNKALALANDKTVIIPGHGKVTDLAGLQAYHKNMVVARATIDQLKRAGKTLEEVKAMMPLKKIDATLPTGGENWHKMFLEFVYNSL